jgi:hypothetical protein
MAIAEIRIVFMGTPAFAVPSLRALLSLREIDGTVVRMAGVFTQPDRPMARARYLHRSAVRGSTLAPAAWRSGDGSLVRIRRPGMAHGSEFPASGPPSGLASPQDTVPWPLAGWAGGCATCCCPQHWCAR